jgi:hypothetical protein
VNSNIATINKATIRASVFFMDARSSEFFMHAIVGRRVVFQQATPLEPYRIGHAAAGRFINRFLHARFGCPQVGAGLRPAHVSSKSNVEILQPRSNSQNVTIISRTNRIES